MDSRRVLIVDDNDIFTSGLSQILRLEGYTVEVAKNGVQALEAIARNRPNVILLDMRMPILDGPGFMRAVKAQGVSVPVIGMAMGKEAAEASLEVDADAWVAKPFLLAQILPTIERLSA
jgi:two-component system, OmpR family, response regulator MprA